MNEDLQGVIDFIIARDEESEADFQGVMDFIIARDDERIVLLAIVVSGDDELQQRLQIKVTQVTGKE